MVQAKFGIPVVAQNQMEIYTTAVLLASIKPPSPPKEAEWRAIMDKLGELSCKHYRYTGACGRCLSGGGGELGVKLLYQFAKAEYKALAPSAGSLAIITLFRTRAKHWSYGPGPQDCCEASGRSTNPQGLGPKGNAKSVALVLRARTRVYMASIKNNSYCFYICMDQGHPASQCFALLLRGSTEYMHLAPCLVDIYWEICSQCQRRVNGAGNMHVPGL